MAEETSFENAERLVASLSAQEQSEIAARVSTRLTQSLPVSSFAQKSTSELQTIEAEWVSRELDEFVKLIQQYRALYLSALFIAVGWILGQAVGGNSATNITTTEGALPPTLESFRQRTDIAAVLCIVPLLNVLFAVLVSETYAHMKSLARYRFILGYALGNGTPAWRWELWRETVEGSTRTWTNPLNVFSVFILFIFTVSALIFPLPAVWNSTWWLRSLWLLALLLTLGLIVVLSMLGIRNRHRNAVAASPTISWSDLVPTEQKVDAGESARPTQPNESQVI